MAVPTSKQQEVSAPSWGDLPPPFVSFHRFLDSADSLVCLPFIASIFECQPKLLLHLLDEVYNDKMLLYLCCYDYSRFIRRSRFSLLWAGLTYLYGIFRFFTLLQYDPQHCAAPSACGFTWRRVPDAKADRQDRSNSTGITREGLPNLRRPQVSTGPSRQCGASIRYFVRSLYTMPAPSWTG